MGGVLGGLLTGLFADITWFSPPLWSPSKGGWINNSVF
jgi:hypothetical protein